jgi:PPK2 family polyphosphate:nucleotide phosphotransferase
MVIPVESPYLVALDGSFRVSDAPTTPATDAADRQACRKRLGQAVRELDDLQRVLYAHDRYAVLLVFQAMDAAGKDSTIRAVLRGVNPAGCQVHSFKQPSATELDHDFLWRTTGALPERGRIGVFNRSYYEEVLVVRVHDGILQSQRLPHVDLENIWSERFESIRDHERHLARNGTVVLKFWLNVSAEEQKCRFLRRLEKPTKRWKFSAGDVDKRGHWASYMRAYEEALNATSRPWAPWYAIPADDKPYMRMIVAELVVLALQRLGLEFPTLPPEERARVEAARTALASES